MACNNFFYGLQLAAVKLRIHWSVHINKMLAEGNNFLKNEKNTK
jgi:hypothetical protein